MDQARESEENIQILSIEISKEIMAAVKKAQRTLNQQSSGGNSSANNGELKHLLAMKANRDDVDKLNEVKTNKMDSEQQLQAFNVLSKQFKHILVLFIESIKC